MAFSTVDEVNVYTCTGQPLRSDIANIVEWMLNEDFNTAYSSILWNAIHFFVLCSLVGVLWSNWFPNKVVLSRYFFARSRKGLLNKVCCNGKS